MLMCQGLDWLEPRLYGHNRIRLLSWRIALFLLLLTILLLVPISFSLILTYRPGEISYFLLSSQSSSNSPR
jgi:hypothetical protein